MGALDYQYTNFATTTIATAITTTTQTSIVVADGDAFPVAASGTSFFDITVTKANGTREIMRVVAHTSNSETFTIGIKGSASANSSGRGVDNTSATTFSVGDVVELRLTAGQLEEFRDTMKVSGGDFAFFMGG